MHFSSGINRPPYETADGYLQTTQGCSHNRCLFCTYFKDQPFCKATIEELEADIKEMSDYFGAPKRIFLHGYGLGNAQKTAELYNGLHPTMVNTSMLTVAPGTPLARAVEKGLYAESTEMEKLEEIHELVRCLVNDTVFMNEHASNTFHVQCRLPESKDKLLAYIEQLMASKDEAELRRYREMVTRAF